MNDELKQTMERLEQEVEDELNATHRPYRTISSYTCSLTIPDDEHHRGHHQNQIRWFVLRIITRGCPQTDEMRPTIFSTRVCLTSFVMSQRTYQRLI